MRNLLRRARARLVVLERRAIAVNPQPERKQASTQSRKPRGFELWGGIDDRAVAKRRYRDACRFAARRPDAKTSNGVGICANCLVVFAVLYFHCSCLVVVGAAAVVASRRPMRWRPAIRIATFTRLQRVRIRSTPRPTIASRPIAWTFRRHPPVVVTRSRPTTIAGRR